MDDRRAAASSIAAGADVTAQLANAAELHARGELSDEEYASAKARVLAGDQALDVMQERHVREADAFRDLRATGIRASGYRSCAS